MEIERGGQVVEAIRARRPRIIFFQVNQSDVTLQPQPPVLAHLIVDAGLESNVERPVDVLAVQRIVGIGIDVILVVGSDKGEHRAAFHHQSGSCVDWRDDIG